MLGATLASELTKLRSLRSTWVTLAVALALGIVISGLVCLGVGATFADWEAAERADWSSTSATEVALLGGIVTTICLIVLAVKLVTAEYASGMIRLTLTATPQRGRLLAAKALVIVAVTLAAGVLATVAMFLVGQAVLAAYDVPTASLGDGGVRGDVLAASATSPVLPLFGAAVAFLLRSAAGAITSVLGLMFVPGIVAELVPDWWREHVLAATPSAAADALQGVADEPDLLAPGLAAIVLAAWLAVFLGGAWLSLARRDA